MNVNQTPKNLYKASGFSLFISAMIVIIYVLLVIVTQQTLPLPAEEVLENPTFPIALFIFAVIGELLLMLGMLGLYHSLKDDNQTSMLFATAFWLTAVIMFLISRGLIFTLLSVSDMYISTTSESMKTIYLALAEYSIDLQDTFAKMALILLNAATIIIGWVMLKTRIFGRPIGYLTLIAGIYTLFTPFLVTMGFPLLGFIGLVLSFAWQAYVGFKLYKLG
jgi:hypothetical protein